MSRRLERLTPDQRRKKRDRKGTEGKQPVVEAPLEVVDSVADMPPISPEALAISDRADALLADNQDYYPQRWDEKTFIDRIHRFARPVTAERDLQRGIDHQEDLEQAQRVFVDLRTNPDFNSPLASEYHRLLDVIIDCEGELAYDHDIILRATDPLYAHTANILSEIAATALIKLLLVEERMRKCRPYTIDQRFFPELEGIRDNLTRLTDKQLSRNIYLTDILKDFNRIDHINLRAIWGQ